MGLPVNPITNFNQTLAAFLSTYGVEFDNEKEESTEDPTPWDWANLVDCIIQTQWEHNRGNANTVKGVAGGSRTGTADIPLTTNQFLVNRAGTLQGGPILPGDLPSHTHAESDVTGLAADLVSIDSRLDALEAGGGSYTDEQARDTIGAALVGGTGITVTVNDGADTITVATTITQYTDEAAQDAVGGALTDSSRIDFTYNDGANTITADIIAASIGTTQLTDDGVTFAKLQNIGTNRMLGRDTAGSGNVEELTLATPFAVGNDVALEFGFSEWSARAFYANPTGSPDVPVEVTPSTGLQWNGTTLESYPWTSNRVLYEVDFNALSNTNLLTGGNGNKTIDGKTWVLAQAANATSLAYGPATAGLEGHPNTTATDFSQTTQTSPNLFITWPNPIGSGYDASRQYVVQVHISVWTNPTNQEFMLGVLGTSNGATAFASWVGCGLLSTTSARLKGNGSTADRSAAPGATAGGTTDRVISLKVSDYSAVGFIDQYSSGWPNPGNVVARSIEGGTGNATENLLDVAGGITLSWRASTAAGTFVATVRRLRVLLVA